MSASKILILASSSSYRRSLLERLQLEFSCLNPDIDESPQADETAAELAARLAQDKASACSQHHSEALIIGSDQVAECDGEIVGKPGSHERARKQLQQCSGRVVHFYTGLCLLNSNNGNKQKAVERYSVYFRQLSDQQIERYLLAEQPYDCAGSFKMEGLGISLFEQLAGDDPTSLIGLPLIQLVSMLNREGLVIP